MQNLQLFAAPHQAEISVAASGIHAISGRPPMALPDKLAFIRSPRPAAPADKKKGFCLSRGEAWIDLLVLASDRPTMVSNKGRQMRLGEGQLLAPVSRFTSRWNWTTQAVRCYFDGLEKWELIATETPAINVARIARIIDYQQFRPAIPVLHWLATNPNDLDDGPGDSTPITRAVLSLLQSNGLSERGLLRPSTRQAVFRKTGGRCTYCGCCLSMSAGQAHSFCVDHVLAVAKGGSDDIANLVPSCASCNAKKGAKTALEFLGGAA